MIPKKYLVACALTAVTVIGTAAPAMADNHYPVGGKSMEPTEQPASLTVTAPVPGQQTDDTAPSSIGVSASR